MHLGNLRFFPVYLRFYASEILRERDADMKYEIPEAHNVIAWVCIRSTVMCYESRD